MEASVDLCCKEIHVSTKITVFPSETLSETPNLENFATASRSCYQQNLSMVEVVDHTCDGWRIVAVYYMLVSCNAVTLFLRLVVVLLYNLFLQLCSSWQDFSWRRVSRSICRSRASCFYLVTIRLDLPSLGRRSCHGVCIVHYSHIYRRHL